jgi:hypothetical protein
MGQHHAATHRPADRDPLESSAAVSGLDGPPRRKVLQPFQGSAPAPGITPDGKGVP